MINILHLLWIIPLSATIGYFTAILMVAAKTADEEIEKQIISFDDHIK